MRRRPRLSGTAGIISTALLAAALLAPVAVTVGLALSGLDEPGLRVEDWNPALRRSLQVAAAVVPLALLIGAPAAYAFRRLPFPGARLLEGAASLPLALPGVALAVSLLRVSGDTPPFLLLVTGHLLYAVPLVIRAVGGGLDRIDPRLEAAARTLGAAPRSAALRVVLPLLAPSLALAALLAFTVSWGELNASFLLASSGPRTFPVALLGISTAHQLPAAAAGTVVFLLPLVAVLAAVHALGGDGLRRDVPP